MGTEATETAALLARWDAFLGKIEGTMHETLEDAGPALFELALAEDGGVVPFLNGTAAVKRQVQDLIGRIHTTWHDQVRPKLRAADPEEKHWDELAESIKGSNQSDGASPVIFRWETVLCGQVAERLHERTLGEARTSFRCTLCSADIEVTENLFRAHYVACPYCSGRNTYEPSTALRETLHFTANHLARYRALDLHDELEAQHERCGRARVPVPDEAVEALRAAHIAYYTKMLKERIAVVPEFAQTYEGDLDRYLREFKIKEAHLKGLPVPSPFSN
ncbi:hypothetical protein Poly30_46050 [Planctomycetes bacterium Poly30]|uniref:Uncharacterized protein n=1 Tax=Saltatorellus ferox TaxID=2528018 RepID=A0A518EY90_9BACT|nr:hypothetical protein Poly30_46050 [Planctomycetes bacterium Poly30]